MKPATTVLNVPKVLLRYGKRVQLRPIMPVAAFLALLLVFISYSGSLRVATADATHIDTRPSYATPATHRAPAVIAPSNYTISGLLVVPACVPGSYSSPHPIDLRAAPLGLTTVIEPPSHYEIYGYQPSDLRDQVSHCAPKGSDVNTAYASETGSSLNWQYSIAVSGNQQCTISNIKVGMHISQIMPLWQPTQYAALGLADKWQTFMASLTTHENGHVALDEQYATVVLNDLRNFPPTSCDSLSSSVDYMVNNDAATLNQANDNYDAATNHGATQGAILPQ